MESTLLLISIVTLGLSLLYILGIAISGNMVVRTVTRGKPVQTVERIFTPAGYVWLAFAGLALAFLTITIISRIVASGHGPFSNMYEFTVAFAWGIILMSLIFLWRYRTASISVIGIGMAFGLLIFANTLPSKVIPLVPALQQSVLLSVHVACAVIAYGAFAIGFSAALLTLIGHYFKVSWIPDADLLDRISYNTMIIGFPFLTLTIILGAVWANIAWGRPWGWDPKETASLVTWLLFAGYLHARVLRGWRGTKSALLLVIGFLAVLFTFFGNYIFQGLHAYS